MAIESAEPTTALISNDIVVFGLIAATLGLIFWLASGPTPFWKKFFSWVPALLLCYFVPALYCWIQKAVEKVRGAGNGEKMPPAAGGIMPPDPWTGGAGRMWERRTAAVRGRWGRNRPGVWPARRPDAGPIPTPRAPAAKRRTLKNHCAA